MCLVWKIVGFDKHSKPCPKHLGSFERQNCAIFLALISTYNLFEFRFRGKGGGGLVYQIQNAPVKQGDNAPNASKCYKPMKGM